MSESLDLKERSDCRWDLVSLGEILLRFDPGNRRIHNTGSFNVWDGGAEYNVAANLSRVFGHRSAIATVLHDNALGRLAEGLARGSGVDTSLIKWSDVGRNGLYFIERGQGVRAPSSAFDRENTAVSRLTAGKIDWPSVFGQGVRWFHTGGIFAGLSASTPAVAAEAMKAAKESGAVVSYDLNYRDSLWGKRGGREAANEVNAELLAFADIVYGVLDLDSRLSNFDPEVFRRLASKMNSRFPGLKIVATTLRDTHSANRHDLGAVCLFEDKVTVARAFNNVEVIDRVGSGDAFVAGFVDHILEGKTIQAALDCGTAHGVLAMTTPGDVSMATSAEVSRLMKSADTAPVR